MPALRWWGSKCEHTSHKVRGCDWGLDWARQRTHLQGEGRSHRGQQRNRTVPRDKRRGVCGAGEFSRNSGSAGRGVGRSHVEVTELDFIGRAMGGEG